MVGGRENMSQQKLCPINMPANSFVVVTKQSVSHYNNNYNYKLNATKSIVIKKCFYPEKHLMMFNQNDINRVEALLAPLGVFLSVTST